MYLKIVISTLVAVFAMAGAAQATTIQGYDSTTPVAQFQFWVDRSYVPTPPGTITVRLQACYFSYQPVSCAFDNDIYVDPDNPHRQFIFMHELGHHFDTRVMTDHARTKFRSMIGDMRAWESPRMEGPSPHEQFADAWGKCSRHRTIRNNGITYYEYYPSPWLHIRVCKLIRQVAAGVYGP